MSDTGWLRYFVSVGVLTLPILAWNVACTRYLPAPLAAAAFNRDIPPLVIFIENTLRIAVMVLPFLMPLEVATAVQRRGLWLFFAGTLLYVLAWIPLMVAPESAWSTSRAGFLAPAYTPLLWLIGLGLTGGRLYGPVPFKPWIYLVLACVFVAVHVTHANVVYRRTIASSHRAPSRPSREGTRGAATPEIPHSQNDYLLTVTVTESLPKSAPSSARPRRT